jgi:hemin uptake protein HemP
MPTYPPPRILPQSPHPSDAAGDAHGAAPGCGVIPSAKLLSGQASVTIDHEGTLYVLRATRAGKLILTK